MMVGAEHGCSGAAVGARQAPARRVGVPVSLRKRVAARQMRELRKRKSLVRR